VSIFPARSTLSVNSRTSFNLGIETSKKLTYVIELQKQLGCDNQWNEKSTLHSNQFGMIRKRYLPDVSLLAAPKVMGDPYPWLHISLTQQVVKRK
jgi:hypothetical protein